MGKPHFKPLSLCLAAALIVGSGALTGCLHDPIAKRESLRDESFDLLVQGQRLKQQGDYILARDMLLRAAESSPRPIVYYEIGNSYYHLENYHQAVAYYEKALELSPDYALAAAERDLALARAGELPDPGNAAPASNGQEQSSQQEASATDEPAAPQTEAPEAAEDLSETAEEVATQETSLQEVTPTEAEAADAEPEPTPAAPAAPPRQTSPAPAGTGIFGGLGQVITAVGDPGTPGVDVPMPDAEEARSVIFPELEAARAQEPAQVRARAEEAERLGRYDEAARLWRRLLVKDEDDLAAHLGLARALYKSGRSQRASEQFALAEDKAAANPDVHFERGNYHLFLGEKDLAYKAFEQALALEPDHLRSANNLAVLEIERANPVRAIRILEDVVEADPDFAAAWLNLALAQQEAAAPPREILFSLENYVRLTREVSPSTERWMRELRQRAAAGNPVSSTE